MDTDETVSVLRRLAEDEGAPARVDLAAAVAMGRRRRRRRRITAGLASAAAVAVAIAAIPLVRASLEPPKPEPKPPTFVGPTSLACTEHRLSVPAGLVVDWVTAADPTGRYLAAGDVTGGRVVIWDNGVPTVLTAPENMPQHLGVPVPVDILPDGTMIGNLNWHGQNWIYRDGRFSQLQSLGGVNAVAIGAQGTIGGTMQTETLRTGISISIFPIMWRTPTSAPTRLPLPEGYGEGRVVDVDTDGTLVGSVKALRSDPSTTLDTWRAVVWWPDGSYRLLPAPRGLRDFKLMRAVSIRDGRVLVAVTAKDATGGWVEVPYLYDLATGRYVRLPNVEFRISYLPHSDPDAGPVKAGNANGGLLLLGTGDVVYTPNAGLTRLPVMESSSGVHEAMPTTINDTNTIIGGADVSTQGPNFPVYWTCH